MKIIEKLSKQIEEEICDAKKYALMALDVKDDHPELGRVLYTISLQEMGHMEMLHDAVVKIIAEYRQSNGDPPARMMDVYEYLHNKHTEDAANVKIIQSMYK